jgi:hypothetical protein
MDWHTRFQQFFFDAWQKAGLPQQQYFLNEYIDRREHGDFNIDWIQRSAEILPGINYNQLRSVYGFGFTTGNIFASMLGLDAARAKQTSDWCGRFNLGISLFDYISDELKGGLSSVTSLDVFKPFVKTDHLVDRALTPVEELLSKLAGTVLLDLKNAVAKKEGSPGAVQLFKIMKRMFDAENFISNENLSADANLKKIEKALYRKSAEPFRLMAAFTALRLDTNDSLLTKNAGATGKALGYCYWLIDDAKDVWVDLKAGRWNLFLTVAAAEHPRIFAKGNEAVSERQLINIWERSGHAEKISRQIINRLVKAVKGMRLPDEVEHQSLGLVWASLWQWSKY